MKDIYLHRNNYEIEKRWDKKAKNWDKNLEDPNHHLNLDGAYENFLLIGKELIESSLNNEKENILLDLACGTGIVSDFFSKYFDKILGIDISEEMIQEANKKSIKNATFKKMDCFDIDKIDEKIDVVCSRGIIISHYGTELSEKLLEAISKILKKDGMIILDFLNYKSKDNFEYKVTDKQYYTVDDVIKLANRIGFNNVNIYGNENNRVLIACIKF